MEQSTLYGTALSTQELYEQEAQFGFEIALPLMEAGHIVVREINKDRLNAGTAIRAISNYGKNPIDQFALLDDETGKTISYHALGTKDILAKDWTIKKLKENE